MSKPNTTVDGPIRALSASAGFFERKKHSPHHKNPALALRALINARLRNVPAKMDTASAILYIM